MEHARRNARSLALPARGARALAGIAWLAIVSLVVHFLWVAQQKYGSPDAHAYGMFWSRRAWLWTHLAGGTLTVLLGPMQFLDRLRNASPQIHRWTGRLYLLGVLVGCAGAVGLIATSPASAAIQVAFAATGIAWLVSAAAGFGAIRARRLEAHRRWMIRNYLVTLAPITFRTALLVPGVVSLASPGVMIPVLLWVSWVVPLLAYETGRVARHFVRSSLSASQPV